MDIEPIAGVDLATYAWVVKQIAPHGYDQSLLTDIAQRCGITADDWSAALDGWSIRLDQPDVADAFRRLYAAAGLHPPSHPRSSPRRPVE